MQQTLVLGEENKMNHSVYIVIPAYEPKEIFAHMPENFKKNKSEH